MRAATRRYAGGALVGLAALTLSGCDTSTSANPLAVEVEEAPDSPWAPTGLPYGAREDNGRTLRLSYREHAVSLSTTNPDWTKAVTLKPGEDTPRLELSTAGATADAAIFQLTPPGGESEVWDLTAEGDWQQIGSGLPKIALADVTGHLVAWVQGAGKNAENRKSAKIVAYDTAADKVAGELDGAKLPGNYLWVMAVNDPTVVVEAVQDSQDAYWSRNYRWNPKTGDLVEFTDARSDDRITITDFDQETESRVLLSFDGPSRVVGPTGIVTKIGSFGFGQFNSDATQVVLEGYGLAKLLDVRTMKPVPLDLPLRNHNVFFPAALSWTADDRLAVVGQMADSMLQTWLCTTSTGACESLGVDYLGFTDNSALGQFAYHDEPEGD
ncbi:MAG: hypothetical protein QM714_07520 [Nocardioides sp.]|uniref:hypothetical protein n=1 Tax=Nocardioides sp. TaxID=35761 RepID=UPI0039E3F217